MSNCDNCGDNFDVSAGGYSSQHLTLCDTCWQVERSRRAAGGVFNVKVGR